MHTGAMLAQLAADLLGRDGAAAQARTERVHISIDFIVELDDPARGNVHGRLGAAGGLQRLQSQRELSGVQSLRLLHLVHGCARGTATVGELSVAFLTVSVTVKRMPLLVIGACHSLAVYQPAHVDLPSRADRGNTPESTSTR